MNVKKIKLSDKRIKTNFLEILGKLSTILSTILIFFGIPEGREIVSAIIFILALTLIYFVIYFRANKLTKASIDIGGTTVSVKQGDIFEEEGLKVIPFNEYFDTIVDNKIISELSLNGKYVKNINQNLVELDRQIEDDIFLNSKNNILEKNSNRKGNIGKKTKYKLGSSVVIDDYVLTAFSKFNDNNEAELTMTQYINFLLNFWDEINRIYAQKNVTVPIFGSGITRFKGGFNNIEINELLNIMLWTFRISETRFKYPAKLTIIIYGDLFNKINLFGLQEDVNYGI